MSGFARRVGPSPAVGYGPQAGDPPRGHVVRCARLQNAPGGERLSGCDSDGVHDVLHVAAARQVVDGLGKALEDRADGLAAGEPLAQSVADVAGPRSGKISTFAGPPTGLSLHLRTATPGKYRPIISKVAEELRRTGRPTP